MSAVLEIAPKFEWLQVNNKRGHPYIFPEARHSLPNQYSSPAVYRWILEADNNRRFLVGETDDLCRRIGEYIKHSSKRHINIRKEFQKTCDLGGEVWIETLQFEPFAISGTLLSADKLYDPFCGACSKVFHLCNYNSKVLNFSIRLSWKSWLGNC